MGVNPLVALAIFAAALAIGIVMIGLYIKYRHQ